LSELHKIVKSLIKLKLYDIFVQRSSLPINFENVQFLLSITY